MERLNRTMKNIMWKYFTANNTQKYIDVLPCMVEKYNNAYHRSIKLTRSVARKSANYQHVHNALVAFFSLCIFSQVRNIPREDNPNLYYWAEITGLHTQTFNRYQSH